MQSHINTLKEYKKQITEHEWAENNHPPRSIGVFKDKDSNIAHYGSVRPYEMPNEIKYITYDVDLLDALIKGYEVVKEQFIKRLNTYLKRYGLTKLNVWTYLSD